MPSSGQPDDQRRVMNVSGGAVKEWGAGWR